MQENKPVLELKNTTEKVYQNMWIKLFWFYPPCQCALMAIATVTMAPRHPTPGKFDLFQPPSPAPTKTCSNRLRLPHNRVRGSDYLPCLRRNRMGTPLFDKSVVRGDKKGVHNACAHGGMQEWSQKAMCVSSHGPVFSPSPQGRHAGRQVLQH